MWSEQQLPDEDGEPRSRTPRLLTVLILLLLVLAILPTLIWPLLQIRHRQLPTPTPGVLQEVYAAILD